MDLQTYLTRYYNKADLAAIVATVVETGEIPTFDTNVLPNLATPGRPSKDVQEAREQFLHDWLQDQWPDQVDITEAAAACGSAVSTLQRWQEQERKLFDDPTMDRWFWSLPRAKQFRLPPMWQGIRLLHYYQLMIANPGISLPLRDHHLHWYVPRSQRVDAAARVKGNYNARQTVLDLMFESLLRKAGWEIPAVVPLTPWEPQRTPDYHCHNYCEVVSCYLHRSQTIKTVGDARTLLGDLPWLEADERQPIYGPTTLQVAAQIMGVAVW